MNQRPLTYLISSGSTRSDDLTALLRLAEAASSAGLDYFQIREKQLTTSVLFDLTRLIVEIAAPSATKVLINDRADIAVAAGAHGVHLPANSLDAGIVRKRFGRDLLIGVSAHSPSEAMRARDAGADLAVMGPVFATPDKLKYGEPQGLEVLRAAVDGGRPMPVIALGGVDLDNFSKCLNAGAAGIAGIRIFADPQTLRKSVRAIHQAYAK